MKKLALACLVMMFAFAANAQDITGTWKTIDDETGEPKSYVQIYEKNGEYFGRVIKILNKDKQDSTCEKCKDYRKDQPIMNMLIIQNLQKINDNKYSKGSILDPKKGKDYKLTIYPDGDKLDVRGYIGIEALGRTQTWHRVKN